MSSEEVTYVLLGFVRREQAQGLVDAVYALGRREDVPIIGIHEDLSLLVESRRVSGRSAVTE